MKTKSQVDSTPQMIEALKQFKEGDRVFNKLTKQHGYFYAPNFRNAKPDCWVRYQEFRADEWLLNVEVSADPLNLELCSDADCFKVEYEGDEVRSSWEKSLVECETKLLEESNQCNKFIELSHCSRESQVYVNERSPTPESQTNSELPNLSSCPSIPEKSLADTTPTSPSTTTLEPLIQNQEALMASLPDSPAKTSPTPENTSINSGVRNWLTNRNASAEDFAQALSPTPPRSLGQGLPVSLEELTIDEERDRHRLEIKVERAFYEAGKALEEIRDGKLYRSTHKTFKEYCKDRFGMKQSRSYQMIDAARVVENLQKVPQIVELLPTNESQCRHLSTLTEAEQVEAWGDAIKRRDGKRPTQTTVKTAVKGIVERTKEKTFVPYTETSEYVLGDVVIVKALDNSTLRGIDGYWGIIDRISDFAYHVCISVKSEVYQCKGDEMKRVEIGEKDKSEIKVVSHRIAALKRQELDDADDQFLELLQRRTTWTNRQLLLLQRMEEDYSINVKI